LLLVAKFSSAAKRSKNDAIVPAQISEMPNQEVSTNKFTTANFINIIHQLFYKAGHAENPIKE